MQATLNVRIDSVVKSRGDETLRRHGISTSEAVRALWDYLGTHKTLPEFLRKETKEEAKKRRRLKAIDGLSGIGKGKYSKLSDDELREIYMSQYE